MPEPPSTNHMIDLAKAGERGIIYWRTQQNWREMLEMLLPEPPEPPWSLWRIDEARFQLWNLRDPLELMAGLKWAVDLLVDLEYFVDDSPRHLLRVPSYPDGVSQIINRKARGVRLVVSEAV